MSMISNRAGELSYGGVGCESDPEPGHESARNHRTWTRRRAARRVELVINHMWQHFDKPLRVSTLSAVAGVSTSHLSTLFKSLTGRSPLQYFICLRIRRACELLRDPDLRVKQVAALLGYYDQFYFSRIFKLVTGVTPSEFRTGIFDSQPMAAPTPVGFEEESASQSFCSTLQPNPNLKSLSSYENLVRRP